MKPSDDSIRCIDLNWQAFGRHLLIALVSLQYHIVAAAQTTVARAVYVAPKYMFGGTWPGGDVNFDSVEDAFSNYQQYFTSRNTASVIMTADGLRSISTSTLLNGMPTYWQWTDHQTNITTNPPTTYSYNSGSIVMSAYCPKGWINETSSQLVDNQWHRTTTCRLSFASLEPAPHSCGSGNPIYPESGLKKQVELDYVSPNGILKFERTYRSDFGRFSSIVDAAYFDYSATDAGYAQCINATYLRDQNISPHPETYCFPVIATGIQNALLWSSTGRLISFGLSSGAATPSSNVNERANKVTDAQGDVTWQVKGEDNKLDVYSKGGLLLSSTTLDGRQVTYTYSTAGTATSVAPRAGLMILATDPFGRTLQFRYTSTGLLSRVIDPAGSIFQYAYDTTSAECLGAKCGRLVSVEYPDQSMRQYLWNEAALVSGTSQPDALTGINEIWPANGSTPAQTIRAGSYGYDSSGRAISTQRAGGLDSYSVFRSSGQVTVTDPLGVQRTSTFSNLFGAAYVASESQPAGSGCSASASAQLYDVNGNVASRNDFNNRRICYSSDLTRNLETTRVEGLAGGTSCSTVTGAGGTLPGGARKISTQWHPDWRLQTKVAEPGRITTSVYNGQPDPFNGDAIASCAPADALLPDGKAIAVLCRQVEQATTDANGSQGFSAALQAGVPNREQRLTYNQYGQVLTRDGPRTDVNDVTTYAYYSDTSFTGTGAEAVGHTQGDLQSITNAAGQLTQHTKYNKHGQVLESIGPNGVVTTRTYDLRQRLLSTTEAGQTTSYTYDATGQLTRITWPDARYVGYEYDPAHRQTAVYDQLGNRIEYTLDNAGNRIAENVKDPGGTLSRQLSRSIDALGRVQQATGRE